MATCTWPRATDYDIYALVRYRDGHSEAVSTFGTVTIDAAGASDDDMVFTDQVRGRMRSMSPRRTRLTERA